MTDHKTPTVTANMRRQVIRVVEHWAQQIGVDVKRLLFRLRTAPLRPEVPWWDPIEGIDLAGDAREQASVLAKEQPMKKQEFVDRVLMALDDSDLKLSTSDCIDALEEIVDEVTCTIDAVREAVSGEGDDVT